MFEVIGFLVEVLLFDWVIDLKDVMYDFFIMSYDVIGFFG